MKPTGVIFDFDGVVVDSLSAHLRAWDTASQQVFGTRVRDPERLAGRSTEAIARLLAGENSQPARAHDLAEAKRELLRARDQSTPSLPGTAEMFAALRKRSMPFGIASNAPRSFIEHALRELNLKVDVVVGIEDPQRGKPYPDPYLLCAKWLGIPISDHSSTLVFEDSTHGLRAAIDAGMIALGVTTQHSSETLLEAGAKLACANLREALDLGWLDEIPVSLAAN